MAADGNGMDGWDPRLDDYECQKFNTYDRGPGQYLPSKIERSKSEGIQLYITGIPNDLTDDGLYNLFSQAGACLRTKKCVSKNPDAGDTYGFVNMGSVADADAALAKFNEFNIGRFRMRVRIAMSEEEMKKRKEKKLEEEEFVKSLPSRRPKTKTAVETSTDSDSTSGSQQKVNGSTMGKKKNNQDMSNGHVIDRAGAQQYPLPASEYVSGGYPYEGSHNPHMHEWASRGIGLLGYSPNSPYPPQSYHSNSPVAIENELQSADPAVLLCQTCPTLNERFNIIENFMQGQRRGYYGSPRRGRGVQHHFPNPYYEDFRYQGGYGRGYPQGGPSYQPRGNYHGAGGQRHFNKKHHEGNGRGQPYMNNENFRGARQGNFPNQGPFQVPFECQSSHPGSMESLNSIPGKAMPKQKIETHPCALCEKPGSFQCSKCKTTYCCVDCQKAHWDDHKERCKEIQAFHKQMKKEDEVFGEISIGEDLIQKMVTGGALEKMEEAKKDATQGAPQAEIEGKTGKQPKPQEKTPPKSEKSSSPKGAGTKSPTTKASPPQQENAEKHSSKAPPMASPDMVPLQVQRRAADTKEPMIKTPPTPSVPKQARGKCLRLSEIPIGSDIQVWVSEVIDPHNIWIQQPNEENIQALTLLMDEMKTIYDQTSEHVASPVVGDVYSAQFSLDGNWYRAKVDGRQGSDMVTVTYLDYGNTETVAITKLRQLQDSMTTLPALAVKCSLADVSPKKEGWGEAVDVLLSLIPPTMASGVAYMIKARSGQGDCYVVDMLDGNGEDVQGKLVKAGVVKVPEESTLASEAVSSSPPLAYSSLPLNEKVLVLTMDVSSPDEIWVQEGNVDKIKHGMSITDKLNEMISKTKLSSVTDVRLGEMYAAYSAKDAGWYRARVDSIREDGTVNVTYVEFGNKENVSLSQMKELDLAMKSEPLTGVHLVLDGIVALPGEATWSDTAIATLKEFVLLSDVAQISYIAEAVGRTATYTSVRMTDSQGCDIADKLVEAGVVRKLATDASADTPAAPKQEGAAAEPEFKRISVMAKDLGSVADTLSPNDVVPIMITDVTSPAEFVVQLNLEPLIRPFATFSAKINNAMQSTPVGYKPQQVGELVLGMYEGVWYRAEVISLDDKEAEVRYIDFGNSEMKEFSLLSAAIESCDSLPAQSVRCCLYGVNPPEVWPQTILQYFAALTESPLEAEFKCMKDNIALIDIKEETDMRTVSSSIKLELENQKPGSAPPVSTVPEVENPSVSAPPVQAVIPKVNSDKVTDTGPIMASDVSVETLPCTIEEAAISSIVDFESFYIQLAKLGRKLAELQESISVYCASASPYKPVQGELVCAKYSLDDQWYRAKVIETLEEGQFNTQFVDYGNCEEVGTDNIRKLVPSLKSLPCQSIHCKLHNVTNEGQSQETLQAFAQIVGGGKVQVEAQNIDGGVFSILLTTADGVDVNSMFQVKVTSNHQLSPHPEERKTGKVKLSEIAKFEPQEKQFDVVISYVASPEEFYCQLASTENIQALELLLQNIMLQCEMGNTDPSFTQEVDDLCCAHFTDGSWNRAAIVKVFPDNTLLVHFLDFGNTEIVPRDKVRPILREYIELPVPAFKCSLQGLSPLDTNWTREASNKLETFYNKRLTVQILGKVGSQYMVELSEGDVKVSDQLVQAGFAKRAQAELSLPPDEAGAQPPSPDEADSIKQQIAALEAQLLELNKKEKKG
ncbi:tudor domain-containing protein 1-like isoform X2 [Mizuhopecten yessoensis]|uniref:tudor domain-containing protein 1-like isoform X2 n=1 Tax=Mizuhopecten yessoensis TaxID=6573 RepID=UPI000B45B1A2|nr:tudor domain-containing protein 1-like isoform X2 [Mizuhopecten yessoensis]